LDMAQIELLALMEEPPFKRQRNIEMVRLLSVVFDKLSTGQMIKGNRSVITLTQSRPYVIG
jgi:hypothetical protein